MKCFQVTNKVNSFYKKIIILTALFVVVLPPKVLLTPVYADTPSSQASGAACNIGQIFNPVLGCYVAKGTAFILSWPASLLYLAGTAFDFSIDYGLNMSERLKDFGFVTNGWAILRDVTNLGYIFILLFVAINIILGTSGYGDKSLIAKVLVTAVFVNFSLFGAKVIIDATNIAALQFYNLITPAETSSSGGSNDNSNARSLTGQFMNVFNLQSIYGSGGEKSQSSILNSVAQAANPGSADYGQEEAWWRIVKLCVMGTIFILAVTVVFFAGAFLFISRTVVLFFLMLFASLAVASRALPATKGQFDDWFKKLINNAIFAPVFMGLIYLFVAATTSVSGKVDFASITLNGGSVSGIVVFFVYLAIIVGILLISKQLGIKGGDTIHGLADKWISPKAIGTRALGAGKSVGKFVGVRVGGGLATNVAESGLVRGTIGRIPLAGRALAKVGEKTGYQAIRDKRVKKIEEQDKYLSSVSQQGPLETDEHYAERKAEARKRAKSAAGFKEDGTKKTGFTAGAMNTARWIVGGRAWTNFQNDKSKKYKKDAKTKNKLDADLKDHATALGKLIEGNENHFLKGGVATGDPNDTAIDTLAKEFNKNGTILDSSGVIIPGLGINHASEVFAAYTDLGVAQHDYDTKLRTLPATDPAIVIAQAELTKKQAYFDKMEARLKNQLDGFKNKFQQRQALED